MYNMKQSASSNGKPRPTESLIVSTADLARHLKLSQWTISRAINGHQDISEKTRQLVLDTMEKHGFRPNPFARALRGRGPGMIGVCFSYLNIPVLDLKIQQLQAFLRQLDYGTILESTSQDAATEKRVLEDFRRIQVNGIVLFYCNLSASQAETLLRSTACVQVDPNKAQHLPTVSLDRAHAMRLLLGHLLELGHRRIALLGILPQDRWKWGPMRELAEEWGLDPDKLLHPQPYNLHAESKVEEGLRMAAGALNGPKRPTAFICLDDLVALGAVQAVRNAGLSVPGDISVTGFNHQDLARVLRPTITTIDQNLGEIVQEAGKLLMAQLDLPPEKRGQACLVKVKPTLIVGESTAAAA